MFFTYVFRELRRRHRQALLTAMGLAVGVALVVAVTAYAAGVGKAQDQVLQSLYGVGTDITVSQQQKMEQGGSQRFGMQPPDQSKQGQKFSRSRVHDDSRPAVDLDEEARADRVAGRRRLRHRQHHHERHERGGEVRAGTGRFDRRARRRRAPSPSSGGSSSQAQTQMAPINVSQLSVSGVDTTNLSLGPLSSAQVSSGRSLTSADAKAKVVLVTRAYAKQNSLKVGDTKKIDGKKFTVVGIVALPAGSTSSDLYIPLSWAQKLSDNAGKVNQIYVKADSADDIAAVQKEIEQVMPKATVTTSSDLAGQVSGSLSSASTLADRLGKWLAIAALIASFAVASLLTVSAVSRRVREFGTLKALGWKGRRIVGQVLGESMVQGIVGAVIGVGLGILGAKLIAAFSPALKATMASAAQNGPPGMQQAADAAQAVTVNLTAPVSLQLIGVAVALALAGALIAGAFGGWRASRLRPADALRRVD